MDKKYWISICVLLIATPFWGTLAIATEHFEKRYDISDKCASIVDEIEKEACLVVASSLQKFGLNAGGQIVGSSAPIKKRSPNSELDDINSKRKILRAKMACLESLTNPDCNLEIIPITYRQKIVSSMSPDAF